MPDLPDECRWPIKQNPCDWRDLGKTIAAIIEALTNICRAFNGDPDDPDDPNNHLFNNLFQRFRLTATLTQGGNAAAVKLNWDGSAWVDGAAITVYDDDTGGMWQGISGYEGWARQAEDESAHYTIVRMFRIAYMVRGTLGGSLSGGSATLTVASYSDGANPGSTVTVHDPNGHWPGSGSGSKAIAFYNFEEGRYEVAKSDQAEWRGSATAGQDYGPTTTSISISGVSFITHPEYTTDPTVPTTAWNTYGQSGFAGDTIYIVQSYATGRWEIITGGDTTGANAPTQVHRFRLQANLSIGGNAAATLLTFNGTTYVEGAAIRIFDRPYPATAGNPGGTRGMWSGTSFQEGYARRREVQQFALGATEYEIVWMEQFGRFIFGTTTEDMGATNPQECEARVDYLFGQGDAITTETFTLHDDMDLYHFALEGAKFFAVRNEYLDTNNPQTPYYQVVVCQQPVLYGKAQLIDDKMCSTPEEGEDNVVEITQFRGWTPSLFNQQLPEGQPGTATNVFGLAAKNGDALFVVGDYGDLDDDGEPKWKIVQAQHFQADLVAGIRWNATKKCIQAKLIEKSAVMSCEDVGDWTDVLCFQRCNNVT